MSLVILIFSIVSVILSITCQSFEMANVKTKQSVCNHFHLPAETDGKFKAQCKHCYSEITDKKKINSKFLTRLNVRHTFLLTFLVSL